MPKIAPKKILKRTLYTLTAIVAAVVIIFTILINVMFPLKYGDIIFSESKKYGIEESLIYAVIWTESKFEAVAVSPAGAQGLMQLLPSTARWCCDQLQEQYFADKLLEPDFNIRLGAFYLSYLLEKFEDKEALAAYNAGEGNVQKWNGEIKFKETRDYVKRVQFAQKIYRFKLK